MNYKKDYLYKINKNKLKLNKRNRFTYFILVAIVMILGLSTRYFSPLLPSWVNLYVGDILWAFMVYLLFGFVFSRKRTIYIILFSFIFTFSIEISQLYHSPWIDTLRKTTIGGLILGYGFLWSDLISYSVGIMIGIFVEKFIILKNHK